jgi:hypothetical protein
MAKIFLRHHCGLFLCKNFIDDTKNTYLTMEIGKITEWKQSAKSQEGFQFHPHDADNNDAEQN